MSAGASVELAAQIAGEVAGAAVLSDAVGSRGLEEAGEALRRATNPPQDLSTQQRESRGESLFPPASRGGLVAAANAGNGSSLSPPPNLEARVIALEERGRSNEAGLPRQASLSSSSPPVTPSYSGSPKSQGISPPRDDKGIPAVEVSEGGRESRLRDGWMEASFDTLSLVF